MSSQAAPRVFEAPAPPPSPPYRLIALFSLITAPIVILDQASKYLVSTSFELFRTAPIIPGWLDLTYVLNPGAAFSLFANMPENFRQVFFIVLSIVAMAVLTALMTRPSTSRAIAVGFAMVLGGTIGNLIDRLIRGRVVDFIYFHHAWFSYPVFNLADSAITLGVAMILIISVFGESPTK